MNHDNNPSLQFILETLLKEPYENSRMVLCDKSNIGMLVRLDLFQSKV